MEWSETHSQITWCAGVWLCQSNHQPGWNILVLGRSALAPYPKSFFICSSCPQLPMAPVWPMDDSHALGKQLCLPYQISFVPTSNRLKTCALLPGSARAFWWSTYSPFPWFYPLPTTSCSVTKISKMSMGKDFCYLFFWPKFSTLSLSFRRFLCFIAPSQTDPCSSLPRPHASHKPEDFPGSGTIIYIWRKHTTQEGIRDMIPPVQAECIDPSYIVSEWC